MTRNDDADHVCAVRPADSPARVFISQPFRHPGIRACFADGNRLQNFPGPQLKLRTKRREWNIELEVFAGKVIGQLRMDCFQMPMFSRHYICSQSFSQGCQLTFGCAAVDKLEQPEAVVISDGDHRSERRIDSLRKKWCTPLRIRRGLAKNPRKRFSKTALRFKTAAVARFLHSAALPHPAQGETHPAGAMISLKSHSVVAFELTSCGRRIDRQCRQFLVGEPPARGALLSWGSYSS